MEKPEDARAECDRFVSAVSHDLIAPLRHIRQFTEALLEDLQGKLGPEQQEYAAFIEKAVKLAEARIYALRQYTSIVLRDAEPVSVDVGELVKEALGELKEKIASRGAVIKADVLPRVTADKYQLLSVLRELITNALQHADAAPQIHISATKENNQWVMCVSDNGPGIPEDQQARVFEPFRQLKNNEDLTHPGIGLSICRRIIARHGGKLWFMPQRSKGTAICFSLPT